MANSAALCRQQEAHFRQLAARAGLQNARKIALTAALAWQHEAEEAEILEADGRRPLSEEDAAIALEFLEDDPNGEYLPDDDFGLTGDAR